MNQKELRSLLTENIITVKDNIDCALAYPLYNEGDSYVRKLTVTLPLLESQELLTSFMDELRAILHSSPSKQSFGLLTRNYILSVLLCLRCWSERVKFDSRQLDANAYVAYAALAPAGIFDPDEDYVPTEEVANTLASMLTTYDSTVLPYQLLNVTSTAGLSSGLSKALGYPVKVEVALDTFEPMDIPDYHELVDLGVFKLRRAIMPSLIIKKVSA